MNIKKIEKKLDKFSKLLRVSEGDNLSSLEKDLLLSYLREIYEDIVDEAPIDKKPEAKKGTQPKSNDNIEDTAEQAASMNRKNVHKEEVEIIEEIPERQFVSADNFRVSASKESIVTLTHEESGDQMVMTESKTQDEQGRITMSKNMELIFSDDKALDLSDKLSRSHVDDILKTMGINDRILAIKELFGNSADIFNQTVQKLNQLPDFESAKSYLMENVAGKYEWDKDEKWPDAQKFIKNVKRRYH
jgi:hypothetical protein